MATYRTVTETSDHTSAALKGRCDLCETNQATHTWTSRTPVTRHHTHGDTATDWWTEARWCVCRGCSDALETGDRMRLAVRVMQGGRERTVKAAFKMVVFLLEDLQPGSKKALS